MDSLCSIRNNYSYFVIHHTEDSDMFMKSFTEILKWILLVLLLWLLKVTNLIYYMEEAIKH